MIDFFYEYFIFFGRVTSPSAKPPFLEDQFVFLSLASHMPSTTNLGGEEIVDAPGKDGNASMPEQVKRPNPWRKMMMMMMK
jgi:hypothetical protein